MGDGREYLRVNITASSRGLKCKMSGKIRHCKNFVGTNLGGTIFVGTNLGGTILGWDYFRWD